MLLLPYIKKKKKKTTWSRNWMLCMPRTVKRMLQCCSLMCDFVACNMLHCSIRLVVSLEKSVLRHMRISVLRILVVRISVRFTGLL